MAGCACAQSRRAPAARASEGREQRMNLATSFAMWAAAPAPGAGGGLSMLLPILLFIPLLYLLMIRPQQKKQKQWQQMLAGIKSGDRITTAGGIRGIILSIKDDSIIIRVRARQSEAGSGQERDRFGHHSGGLFELLRPSGLLAFGLEKRTNEEESQEQNCPDHRGAADLSVRHLRDPIGSQREGLAERHVQPDSSGPGSAGRRSPHPAGAGGGSGERRDRQHRCSRSSKT